MDFIPFLMEICSRIEKWNYFIITNIVISSSIESSEY